MKRVDASGNGASAVTKKALTWSNFITNEP